MAVFKLIVVISGLVAYVPGSADKEVTLLLKNETMVHQGHLKHSPQLMLRQGVDVNKVMASCDGHKCFDLSAGYVIKASATKASPASLVYKRCANLLPRLGYSKKVDACVVPLGWLVPGYDLVNPDYLTKSDATVAAEMVARWTLSKGTLEPQNLKIAGADQRNARLFKLTNLAGTGESWVPDKMVYEVEFVTNTITLELVPLLGGPTTKLVLKPEQKKPILLELTNEPLVKDICDQRAPKYYQHGHLDHLTALSWSRFMTIPIPPELAEESEREAIAKVCEANGGPGGGLPAICYSAEMRR